MENPFLFGAIVDGDYFTDRQKELKYVSQVLNSRNHLILISPRRYGKTSLVLKAAAMTDRPVIFVNLEQIIDKRDLAATLLKRLLKLFTYEKIKYYLSNFSVVPSVTFNPSKGSVSVSFMPKVEENVLLEDVFNLMEEIGGSKKRLIVIFDEFQYADTIDKKLSHILRAIMQMQKNINYVMLGSQETMMREIFEDKKSPFYHFGTLMTLNKIPRKDFQEYLIARFNPIVKEHAEAITNTIINFSDCHPYYTQKTAFHIWNIIREEGYSEDYLEKAIELCLRIHNVDYERLWLSFNPTDRKVLKYLAAHYNLPRDLVMDEGISESTVHSSLRRLLRKSVILREGEYVLEDPFFERWITRL